MEDQTSIKQMIQSMSPDGAGVVEGTVTNAAPLEITLTNDAKMILSANSLIVPERLTDHEIETDIVMGIDTLHTPTEVKINLHTGLKVGEIVYLLSYNNGKKYYVLDRRGE